MPGSGCSRSRLDALKADPQLGTLCAYLQSDLGAGGRPSDHQTVDVGSQQQDGILADAAVPRTHEVLALERGHHVAHSRPGGSRQTSVQPALDIRNAR